MTCREAKGHCNVTTTISNGCLLHIHDHLIHYNIVFTLYIIIIFSVSPSVTTMETKTKPDIVTMMTLRQTSHFGKRHRTHAAEAARRCNAVSVVADVDTVAFAAISVPSRTRRASSESEHSPTPGMGSAVVE